LAKINQYSLLKNYPYKIIRHLMKLFYSVFSFQRTNMGFMPLSLRLKAQS